jgi:ATP adenylyltransferase
MDTLWTPWRYAYVSTVERTVRPGVPAGLEAWPGDKDCVFCNLLASADYAIAHGMDAALADRAALIVWREQHCYICLNSFPYNSGHIMIVPRRHEAVLACLDPAEANELMTLSQRADRVLGRTYAPDGINMGINLGKAAGAGVAGHLHAHMVPRWAGDTNFMTVFGETRVLPETLETTWEKLRAGFAEDMAH